MSLGFDCESSFARSVGVAKLDELFDPFEHVDGTHDGVTGHLPCELVMRNHNEVDRVRVVQLARVAHDLLQLLRQTA